MKRLLAILLIITISVTILISSIENNTYNKDYYIKSFQENGVVEVTGKSISELGTIVDSTIEYLKRNGYDELLIPFFNDREVAHMRDVQDLFDIARTIKYITLVSSIILIAYFAISEGTKKAGRKLFFGLFANHIIIILMSIIIYVDFSRFWTFFHHIFFVNDLWLLNPKTDLMIQMLPEPFFSGIIIKIVLSFFINLSILQLAGVYFMKRGKGKWEIEKKLRKDIWS